VRRTENHSRQGPLPLGHGGEQGGGIGPVLARGRRPWGGATTQEKERSENREQQGGLRVAVEASRQGVAVAAAHGGR
jgi:hypothetical protein